MNEAEKANKAFIKNLVDHERTHYVYRCYNADDVLIYIGCTSDPGARMEVHRSSWHNPASAQVALYMTRYTISEPIKGRIAARAAEKAAIEAEQPYANIHFKKKRTAA